MTNTIEISIVTPTYNRGASYLPHLVQSVALAISLSTLPTEHIIIDDGSTDDTKQLVQSYQQRYPHIRYVRNDQNMGLAKCRNIGLHQARGRFLIDIDDDDVLPYYSLPVRVQSIQQSSARWLIGDALQINESGELLYNEPLITDIPKDTRRAFCSFYEGKSFAFSGTRMYYAQDLKAIGGWNEAYRNIGEDLDLWLRMTYTYGAPAVSHLPLIMYRKKEQSMGINSLRSGEMETIISDIRSTYKNQYQEALATADAE